MTSEVKEIANTTLLVAKHYSSRRETSIEERRSSAAYKIRTFNNWIKRVLIRTSVNKYGSSMIDFCCGKLGDLQKCVDAGITRYMGYDISEATLKCGYDRVLKKQPRIDVHLAVADCGTPINYGSMDKYDIAICMFGMHYICSTEARTNTFLNNVANSLKSGSRFICIIPDEDVLVSRLKTSSNREFGNKYYKVRFEYNAEELKKRMDEEPFGIKYQFTLVDCVDDCIEYLVNCRVLINLAARIGLKCTSKQSFDEVYASYSMDERFSIGQVGLDYEEHQVSSLYTILCFVK